MDDFGIGTLLLWLLGALALGLTCSLGFWARLRERSAERKREEQRLAALAQERRPATPDRPGALGE